MTNEQAIEILKYYRADASNENGISMFGEALDMAIKALEMQRWIPVSERLPEDFGTYLVCTDGGYITTILYEPHGLGWFISDNIIAWQELPQPYKAESEE